MKNESGFTLIELLVTTAIIGILASTSLQILAEYRQKAFDDRAIQDLRTTALAEEAYFQQFEVYKDCSSASNCTSVLLGIPQLSPGTVISFSASPAGFIGGSSHPQGTGRVYSWNSELGGLQ